MIKYNKQQKVLFIVSLAIGWLDSICFNKKEITMDTVDFN